MCGQERCQKWFSIVGLSFFCLICSGLDSEQAPKILTWCLGEQWNTCYKLPKYKRQKAEHVKVLFIYRFCLFTQQEQHLTFPNGDGYHSKRTVLHYLHLYFFFFFFFCKTSQSWVGRTMRNKKISGDGLMVSADFGTELKLEGNDSCSNHSQSRRFTTSSQIFKNWTSILLICYVHACHSHDLTTLCTNIYKSSLFSLVFVLLQNCQHSLVKLSRANQARITSARCTSWFINNLILLPRSFTRFFYKNNFIRTTRLKFAQKLKTS